MKVKIGNMIYNTKDEPIMIILTTADKANISKMSSFCEKYCVYPDWMNKLDIRKWMKKT